MMKKLLVIIAMLAICAVSSQAAVIIWTGDLFPGGNGNYTNGLSWTADTTTPYGSIPLATDSHGLVGSWVTAVMPTIDTVIPEAPTMLGIGWDLGGYGELNVVPGGSITANDVYIGFDDNNPSKGVLNISGGNMVVGATLTVGGNNGSTGTVNQSGGVLHLALPPVFNHGVINLSDTAFFLINGDQTGLDLVGNGWVATAAPKIVAEVYNSIDGRTEYTVVPEPAFLGFIVLGALALIRRK